MAKAKNAKTPDVEVSSLSIDPERERKWRAEDALRTLMEADKVRKDKPLMRDVEKARNAKIAELDCVKVETSPKTIGRKR